MNKLAQNNSSFSVSRSKRIKDKKNALVFDLIERAKLEWELTADALPQLICILDKNGKILRANRTLENWKIGSLKNIRGKKLHATLHPHCRDPKCYLQNKWAVIYKKIIKKEPSRLSAFDRFLRKDIQAHFYPIPGGTKSRRAVNSFAVMIMQDFTDIKNTEDRLIESYKYIGSINRRLDVLLNINNSRLGREKLEIFRNINIFAMDLFQSNGNLVYKFEKNKKCFRLLSASPLPHGYKNKINKFPEKISETVSVFREKKIISLVKKKAQGMDMFEMDGKFSQFLLIPLMNGRDFSGMLVALFKNPKKISEEDMFFYEMFSFKLSLVLLQMKII